MDIRVSAPHAEDDDIQAVVDVLRSGRLAAGPVVTQLEQSLATITGARHVVAVSSGTAALHAAVAGLEIGPGSTVVTTPFSFVGSVNPVLMQGGSLQFVDIDLDDFGPDIAALKDAVGPQTSAVIAVDLYGQPVDAEAVHAITDPAGVPVIEDACQAIGASLRGAAAGSLFAVGCFSFYATKNVMGGEGGALVTNCDDVAAFARRFRQHGMVGPYEYAEIGFNYRMTDVIAALVNGQLNRLRAVTDARAANAAYLSEGLRGLDGLVLPSTRSDRTHAWHQYVVRVTSEFPMSRDALLEILAEKRVHAAVYYPKPLTAYPHVAAATVGETDFPNAARAAREVLALPVHPRLTHRELDRVIDVVRGCADG